MDNFDKLKYILIPYDTVQKCVSVFDLEFEAKSMLERKYPYYELVRIELPYAICKEKVGYLF